jgi:hypothetical protein
MIELRLHAEVPRAEQVACGSWQDSDIRTGTRVTTPQGSGVVYQLREFPWLEVMHDGAGCFEHISAYNVGEVATEYRSNVLVTRL